MDAFVLQMTPQESTQCIHNSMGVKSCFMYPRFYRGRQITANRYSMTCFLFHWNVTSLLQCGNAASVFLLLLVEALPRQRELGWCSGHQSPLPPLQS